MFQQEIERGARLLDEHGPADWRDRINTGTLDLSNMHECVLGQTFSDAWWYGGSSVRNPFEHGMHALGGPTAEKDETIRWGARFGFALIYIEYYSELTAEWREYVTRTRAALPTSKKEKETVSV
jgi:hypothetical protein